MASDSHLRKGGSGCVRIGLHTKSFGDKGGVTISCRPEVGHLGERELACGQSILGPSN